MKNKSISISDIAKIVADYFEMTVEDMYKESRKREIVQARQFAHTMSVNFTKYTKDKIGKEIGGKDHATVIHSKKTIQNLCDTDKLFKYHYDMIEYLIKYKKDQLEFVADNENYKKARLLVGYRSACKRNKMSYKISLKQ